MKDSLKTDTEIGPIIEEKLEKFKLYQQYSMNYADATQCLERNMKDSKPFAQIIKQTDKKDASITNFLRRPLKRVEEYIFALDAYSKSLPPGSKDRMQLEECREQLHEILDSIGERESVADNLARVMEIGVTITELDENLVRPDRRFIHEGPAKLFKPDNPKKPIADYLFLFNDVIIYCNCAAKGYSYVGRMYMHTISVEEAAKAFTIEITENEKDKFYLTSQTAEEFDDWLFYLGKGIREVERNRKVFGVPLRTLMRREKESDIPLFVEKSIKFIYDYGMSKEGLFRLTGRSTQIEKLKGQLNQGAKVFFSENMDVHTVASLFKQWLRELPDPLLTWAAYDDFLHVLDQPIEDRPDLLRGIIDRLPRVNRFVCQHLFKCLYLICENEAKTKMNPTNLAVVFAPNILRNPDPNANPFDQSYYEFVNEIFTTMVKNYVKVFANVEKEREKSTLKESGGTLRPRSEKKENRRSRQMSDLKLEDGVLKEGALFCLEKKKWKQYHIILKPLSLEISKSKERKPKLALELSGAQLSSAPASGRTFSFNVDIPGPTPLSYCFSAKNSDEYDEWMVSIREASSSSIPS